MKSLILFLFYSISFFSFIFCNNEVPTSIIENNYGILSLGQDRKLLLLHNYNNFSEMLVDIMFSSPSKYEVTFNAYEEDPLNNLSSDYSYNQTDLIIKEDEYFGKNRLYLNLVINQNETIEQILLFIKRKDNLSNNDDKIMIRYIFEENKEIYILKNKKINITQEKDILNISFGGISPNLEEDNLTNITATYNIYLIDKNTLESNFENIYFYGFSERDNIFLYHKELKFKGNIIQYDNYIRIKAPLNDKNEQIIFIKAEIKYYGNIFIYEVEHFKVLEISEKAKPKGKKKKINAKKNRKKNKSKLIIIMSLFLGSVIFTFIFVFIYLKISKNEGLNNKDQQEYDYKNIGEIKTCEEDEV